MYSQVDRTYPRNNNYQGTGNYQGPRGNYNANTRFPPRQYQRGYQNSRFPTRDRREFDRRDPRLHYPAGPPLEPQPRYPMPTNDSVNQSDQTGHLNSKEARPEAQETSQPIASMSNAQSNPTPSRVYVLQRSSTQDCFLWAD